MVERINKACKYYPCHKELEDCTFCYCTFYPCEDNQLGQYVISKVTGEEVWSCKDCSFIHRKDVVDHIYSNIKHSVTIDHLMDLYGS